VLKTRTLKLPLKRIGGISEQRRQWAPSEN